MEHLYNTQDLSIFETKLIQIYLLMRWRQSLWFFILYNTFILAGLFDLFLYAAFFRTPFALLPLLLFQLGNLVIEAIEIRNKGCATYLRDFWNYFDILRFVLSFTYFGVIMAERGSRPSPSEDGTKPVLLTLLSFFQSVKAFHIFSLFKNTRVLL